MLTFFTPLNAIGTEIAVFGTPSPVTSIVFEGSAGNYQFSYDISPLPHTILFNSSLSDTENHSIMMHNYDFGTITNLRWSLDYIIYNVGNSSASGASENCHLAVLGDTPVENAGGGNAKIFGGVFGGIGGLLLLAALYKCYKWRRSRLVLAQEVRISLRLDLTPMADGTIALVRSCLQTPATSLGPYHVPGVNNIISLAHLYSQRVRICTTMTSLPSLMSSCWQSDRHGESEGDEAQPVTEDDPAGRRVNHIQEIGILRLQGG
jgi:hypothetical protein